MREGAASATGVEPAGRVTCEVGREIFGFPPSSSVTLIYETRSSSGA